MVLTVLKSNFEKKDPTILKYRSYKHFEDNLFKNDLIKNLKDFSENQNS